MLVLKQKLLIFIYYNIMKSLFKIILCPTENVNKEICYLVTIHIIYSIFGFWFLNHNQIIKPILPGTSFFVKILGIILFLFFYYIIYWGFFTSDLLEYQLDPICYNKLPTKMKNLSTSTAPKGDD